MQTLATAPSLKYFHENPVVAGFVNKPEDWKYSSAADFCGSKGLVELNYSSLYIY